MATALGAGVGAGAGSKMLVLDDIAPVDAADVEEVVPLLALQATIPKLKSMIIPRAPIRNIEQAPCRA